MNQNTLTATHEAADEVTYLQVPGGRIAYEVTGQGPLIVLAHGIGDVRQSYRFLAPLLVKAGYRVANADLRGHGDSSVGFESISRSDVAGDLLALIRRLGGAAVIVGQSLSGGAATIAAAQAPELVAAIVEINPFTRVPKPIWSPCCVSGDTGEAAFCSVKRQRSTACVCGCATSTWRTRPSPRTGPTTRRRCAPS